MAGTSNNAGTATKNPVGKVEKATGTVEVVHPDGTRGVLHVGDIIFKGDVIVTSSDGAVGITFADASTFALGKSGRMTIDELVYDPDSQSGQSALSVVKGAFSYASGHIAKTAPDAATLKTPVMTIGIRGTTVAGMASAEGEENSVALLQDQDGGTGQIIITNGAGSVVLNNFNQQIQMFSAFQPPPPPVTLSPQDVQRIYSSVNDFRPPSPPPTTLPQQIVPDFQPSAPSQSPNAPDQHGNSSNTDHPVVSYTPPVYVNQPLPPPIPPVLTQLETNQRTVVDIATGSGNQGSGTTGGNTGTTNSHSSNDDTVKTADSNDNNNNNNGNNNDNNGNNNDGNNGNNSNGGGTHAPNGRVIDGYVANVVVFRDLNNNGVLDNDEATATTDGSGKYYLSGSGGTIVVKAGGTDSTTGKPLPFDMKAPGGSTVVTPLTTMMVALTAAGVSNAENVVRTMLGLDDNTSLTSYDPVATFDKAVLTAIAKVAATVNAMTSALTGGSVSPSDAANAVFSAMAEWAHDHTGSLNTFNLTNPDVLYNVLNAAATSTGASVDVNAIAAVVAAANSAIAVAFANATSLNDNSLVAQLQSALSSHGSLTDIIGSGLSATTDSDGNLYLSGSGDLTALNLSMCHQFRAEGGNAILSLTQWDVLDGNVTVGSGTVSIIVTTNANLLQPHSGLADAMANGLISHFTIAAGTTVTLDAATLTQWYNAGIIELSMHADITIVGDVNDVPPEMVPFIDHFSANHSPVAEPAAVFALSSNYTFTISASDPEGRPLTYSAPTSTDHGGSLEYLGNGQFRYNQSEAYNGLDTFNITISDGTTTVIQQVAVMATSQSGSPSVTPFIGSETITAPVQGAWVDAHFSLNGTASTVVTVVVYLTTNGDGGAGALRVGSESARSLWTMTDTVAAINLALKELQYQAPTTVGANGSDYINIAVYDGSKASIGDSGFTVHYVAPKIFTGDSGSAWTEAGNWDGGVPSANGTVVINADNNNSDANPECAAVIGTASTLSMKNVQVLSGATLAVAGSLTLNGAVSVAGTVDSGTVDGRSSLHVSGTGSVTNNGTLNLAGTITVDSTAHFNNYGTLEIGGQADQASDGSGIGTASVQGAITFGSTSAVVLEVAGDGATPRNDKLVFNNGTASVDLSGEFLVNVDPLAGYVDAPTTVELITGVAGIDGATFGITGNSAPLAIVGINFNDSTGKVTAGIEGFRLDNPTGATYACGIGQDFVFGATGLENTIFNIEDTDQATGAGFNDTFIVGADGAWIVNGGAGDDTLTLSAGNDYTIEAGQVTSIETFNIVGHTPSSPVSLTLNHGVNATITGISSGDQVYGGTEQDTFVVSNSAFGTIAGGGGTDTLVAAGTDINLSGAGVLASSIESLQVNTTEDTAEVRLTLDAAGVAYLNNAHTVAVSFNGGSHTDDLFLFGSWDSDGYSGGNMTFSSVYNSTTATVNVTVRNDGDTLVAAKMMGSDGTHVKTTTVAGADPIAVDAGSGIDYIHGADQHSNIINNIGFGDYVYGGSKDDTFTITSSTFGTVYGGEGTDTLVARGDLDLSSDSVHLSGIEKLILDNYDDHLVTLTLNADSVRTMTSGSGNLEATFSSDSANYELLLSGDWAMGTNGATSMNFSGTGSHGSATVSVGVPSDGMTLIGASTNYSDGTHITSSTAISGNVSYYADDYRADTIICADQATNAISGIGSGDTVYGGSKDDNFSATATDFTAISGGAGNDTLTLGSGSYDLTSSRVTGIETINLTGSANITIDTTATANTAGNKVTIFCDDSSTIHVNNSTAYSSFDDGNTTYETYTLANSSTIEVIHTTIP